MNLKTQPWVIELDESRPGDDENSSSSVSIEPALRSVIHLQPYYDFSDINIITDCDVLAELLSCDLTAVHTYIAELIGGTIILLPEQATVNEGSHGKYARAFASGHFTHAPSCEDTQKHYRLTSYRFGEVRLLVRHEADGMHGRSYLTHSPPEASEALDLGNARLTFGGEKISPDAVMEFHVQSPTGSQGDTDDATSVEIHASHLPKLWLAQISKFTVATPVKVAPPSAVCDSPADWRADAVVFPRGNIHTWPSVRQDTAKWEKEHQSEIAALHEKLAELREGVKAAAADQEGTMFRCTLIQQLGWSTDAVADGSQRLAADLVERVKKGYA